MKVLRIPVLLAGFMLLALIACNNKSETSSSGDTTNKTTAVTPENSAPIPTDSLQNQSKESQTSNTGKSTTSNKTKKKGKTTVGMIAQNESAKQQVTSGVYEYTEVRPAYPGGKTALENYINSNINYPDAAVENNTQGTIEVQFTIDESGKVSDVHTIGNKLGNGLEEEAERVVANMPKWTAGTVKGKAVKSKITLPITFRIEEQ